MHIQYNKYMETDKRENFDDLVDFVWQQIPHRDPWQNANLKKQEVAQIVTIVFDTIIDRLADGSELYIKRFGKFKVVKHQDKKIRLPNGETRISRAKKYAKFKQFKKLRDAI